MNDTNRAVNRILLLVIGLVLLATGAAIVLAAAWPAAAETWQLVVGRVDAFLGQAAEASLIGESGLSWLALGALAVIVLIVVGLIAVLARLGGGRTGSVLRSSGAESPLGRVVVTEGFAADALTTALLARPDVAAAKVTASRVRDETVMHLSITPRRNASLRVLATEADRLASNLAVLTGQDLPTYISLRAGLRARFASEQRDLA